MRSIKEVFIIGHGPSSSHTMGPAFACDYIIQKYKNIKHIQVILYGSLALTGRGHLTDYIIHEKLKDYSHEIKFDFKTVKKHPNTLEFLITKNDDTVRKESIVSVGGGVILVRGVKRSKKEDIYPHKSFQEVLDYCNKESLSLTQYVERFENKDIRNYLKSIIKRMDETYLEGVSKDGILPGSLKVKRKAKVMYENAKSDHVVTVAEMVSVTSFAICEQNAAGGIVVIAPTCGSSGVIPGVITYLRMQKYSEEKIIDGLLVAGLFGAIAKSNASVSGAECGCQAEIGVASSMAAAMILACEGDSNENIGQAAEIALEHSLGLTCDPVQGLVQIPCIERNAIFALKAINAAELAKIIPWQDNKVDFDTSLKTMYQTGKDLRKGYRETSISGLAKNVD